jgi:hypothetical protein
LTTSGRRRRHLRCVGLPGGYVVQTPRIGYCERLKQTSGGAGRRCSYITLLREPKARVRSAWSYYCRACAEPRNSPCADGHHQAARRAAHNVRLSRDAHGVILESVAENIFNSCPNMSLADYAVMEGNRYMLALAGRAAARGASISSEGAAAQGVDEAPVFRRAWQTLHRPDLLLLFTERLDRGDLANLSHALGDPTPAPNASSPTTVKAMHMHSRGARRGGTGHTWGPRRGQAGPWRPREMTTTKVHDADSSAEAHVDRLLGRVLRYDIAIYKEALRLRGQTEA